jgi:hypothetical protein
MQRETAALADADRREHLFDHPAVELGSRALTCQRLSDR